MIDRKHLIFQTTTFIIEGMIAFLLMWVAPVDAGRGNIIDYATLRLIMAGFYSSVLVLLLMLVFMLWRDVNWGDKLADRLDDLLVGTKNRLFLIQGVILVLFLFLTECFLMSFVSFPVPMRSLFVWASLVSFQVWLFLRIVYKEKYRTRQSLPYKIKALWKNWLPEQRKTFYTIAGFGLIYFMCFMPINYLPDQSGNFIIHQDEEVLYPDVTQVFIPQRHDHWNNPKYSGELAMAVWISLSHNLCCSSIHTKLDLRKPICRTSTIKYLPAASIY